MMKWKKTNYICFVDIWLDKLFFTKNWPDLEFVITVFQLWIRASVNFYCFSKRIVCSNLNCKFVDGKLRQLICFYIYYLFIWFALFVLHMWRTTKPDYCCIAAFTIVMKEIHLTKKKLIKKILKFFCDCEYYSLNNANTPKEFR